jgi:hypothetical protein
MRKPSRLEATTMSSSVFAAPERIVGLAAASTAERAARGQALEPAVEELRGDVRHGFDAKGNPHEAVRLPALERARTVKRLDTIQRRSGEDRGEGGLIDVRPASRPLEGGGSLGERALRLCGRHRRGFRRLLGNGVPRQRRDRQSNPNGEPPWGLRHLRSTLTIAV